MGKMFDRRYVIGDIHGHWDVVQNGFYKIEADNVLYIQIGDFNIGYRPVKDEMADLLILDNILINTNSYLWIIRGNHDNPFWFMPGQFEDQKSQLKRIEFIPDWTTREVDGEKFFFLGGATSIDRLESQRKMKENEYLFGMKTWWKEETIDFNGGEIPTDADRMFAHTAPNICKPFTKGHLVEYYAKDHINMNGKNIKGDHKLLDDLDKERENMTNIVQQIPDLKSYYYGHFHSPYSEYVEGCHFRCISIDEFFEF